MIRRSTLVTDGPTDRVLLHVLEWILRSAGEPLHVAQWFDPRPLPRRPADLAERVRLAVCLYPCDLLFVHRDAERTPPDDRREETRSAIDTLGEAPPAVPVIPVRMTEAWLLFDEPAMPSCWHLRRPSSDSRPLTAISARG